MMKRIIGILQILLLVTVIPATPKSGPDEIRIDRSQVYPKGITSFGGQIEIEGKVTESVLLVSGKVILSGEIGKDLICLASQVEIKASAVIQGDLIVLGGTMVKDDNSRIKGEFIYIRTKEDLKKIMRSFIPFFSEDEMFVSFLKITRIILWLIIALIVLAIFPNKVKEAFSLFDKATVKIGAIGLFSFLGFILLLIVFIALSLIIVGIPLLLILILVYLVITVFGRTVFFYYVGQKISSAINLQKAPPSIYILFGILIYAIVKFIPYIGFFLVLIMDILVLGIGVSYFLRKKITL